MEEVHLTTIKPRNNVLLLAQEISFAKVLACNDKRLRDRGLRRLKKWFMSRSQGSMGKSVVIYIKWSFIWALNEFSILTNLNLRKSGDFFKVLLGKANLN